jgi:hypothetical protein
MNCFLRFFLHIRKILTGRKTIQTTQLSKQSLIQLSCVPKQEGNAKEIFMKSFFFEQKKTSAICIAEAEEKLGGDLLFHTLEYSTIGDEGLDF